MVESDWEILSLLVLWDSIMWHTNKQSSLAQLYHIQLLISIIYVMRTVCLILMTVLSSPPTSSSMILFVVLLVLSNNPSAQERAQTAIRTDTNWMRWWTYSLCGKSSLMLFCLQRLLLLTWAHHFEATTLVSVGYAHINTGLACHHTMLNMETRMSLPPTSICSVVALLALYVHNYYSGLRWHLAYWVWMTDTVVLMRI